jgi:hypothetical protein
MLKRQHRPAKLLELPPFMEPKPAAVPPAAVDPIIAAPQEKVALSTEPTPDAPAKRLICSHCGTKISFPEGKFCWNNSTRFGGNQYCRAHQALFS